MSRERAQKLGWPLRCALSIAGGRRRPGGAIAVLVAVLPASAACGSPADAGAAAETVAVVASSSVDQLTCGELSRRARWLAPDVRQRREGESEDAWRGRLAAAVLVEEALAARGTSSGAGAPAGLRGSLGVTPPGVAGWRDRAWLLGRAVRHLRPRSQRSTRPIQGGSVSASGSPRASSC